MPRGPRAAAVDLTAGERAELERLLRRRGVGQALAQRVRIVSACAEPGATNPGVATALGVSRPTVATWRRRFAQHRLEGLTDAPRPGTPRTLEDEAVERRPGRADPGGGAAGRHAREYARDGAPRAPA